MKQGNTEREGGASKSDTRPHVAIVGSGAAGLSAAWLLSESCRVTLLEAAGRLGGHANTAEVASSDAGVAGAVAIDTGFIVYNEPCYPNLTAWFDALDVPTVDSDMSFGVSRQGGQFEYAGGPVLGLVAQPSLWFTRRYLSMLRDLLRFYREAASSAPQDLTETLGDFVARKRYSSAFVNDHLVPFAAAIWSTPTGDVLDQSAREFIRFCDNHGLLRISGRPQWRTVEGGSREYVQRVAAAIERRSDATIQLGTGVQRVSRGAEGVRLTLADTHTLDADAVVFACHADQTLALLADANDRERSLLGEFIYRDNIAVLHRDAGVMPQRRAAWSSWNYVERAHSDNQDVSVSYWMNRLQPLPTNENWFVSLNPEFDIDSDSIAYQVTYRHPQFNTATAVAQQSLWSLQGHNRSWFCGSFFGAGFHEDAVQAGLAVGEQLGGVMRPWRLDNPSTRIVVTEITPHGD